MIQLALTQQFQKAQLKLSAMQQQNVNKAILKLQQGLAATRLHALPPTPFKSFVVNQDALRVICQQDGDTLILLYVDAHDPAYDWARRHELKQVGRIVRIIESEVVAPDPAPVPAPVQEQAPAGPLADIPDKHFSRLDVPPRAAQCFREIGDEVTLLDVASCCRPALGEALLSLASEPERWQEIARTYHRPPAESPSLAEALKDTANAAAFHLPPPGEEAWAAALAAGAETWKRFLHPSQRRIVEKRTSGPFKVTGGPGTGKTIVALHRTRFLAEQVFPEGVVLLTTFSRVLTEQLAHSLELLDVGDNVVTETLTSVAQQVLKSAGKPSALIVGPLADACWNEALELEALDRPRAFYTSEREHVLARHGVWTEQTYLRVPRSGRRSKLNRAQRAKAWTVFAAYESALLERGGGDGAALAREAARLLREGQVERPFAAVVCDEIQDVGAPELRLLAALTEGPDSLFLCGDGHQRIYSAPISLKRCDIDVRGRASRLRLNYRTTEGIRRAAVATVQGLDIDALDEQHNPLDGYRSLRGGPAPVRMQFETPEAEADWIADRVRDHPDTRTLLLARTNALLKQLEGLLVTRGLTPTRLGGDQQVTDEDRLILCTLHRAKGLEAPRVIILGAQSIPMTWHGKGDAGDKAVWERRERCLMYVGMTRARDWCAITRTSGA